MNKEQRQYLIKEINAAHTKEIERLRKLIPDKPALNNYIISAILNGTVVYKDAEELHETLTKKVKNLGGGKELIKTEHSWKNEPKREWIEVDPELIFEVPSEYRDAMKSYQEKKFELELRIQDLAGKLKNLELRINIGSNATLAKMIEEVDSMGELSLIGHNLLLGEADTTNNKMIGSANNNLLGSGE